MPFIYRDPGVASVEDEKLKGKDLGVSLDIGGRPQDMDLNPAEKMAKEFGGAVTEVVSRGAQFATKLPIVEPAFKAVADSPIGWAIGKGLDLLNVPSFMVQQFAARLRMLDKTGLPDDIKNMLASGRNADEVADYMVNSQRAFSDSKEANLIFQILLDPLNFTPLAFSKISMLKPLSAAAGLIGGAAVAGPVGGAIGAFGAYKAGRAALRSAETAYQAAGKLDELGAVDQILLKLEKGVDKTTKGLGTGYGANYSERLSVGVQNQKIIADSTAEIKKLTDIGVSAADSRIVKLNTDIQNAESANSIAKAVENGFTLGMYKGLVGAKSQAGNGIRAVAGALLPSSQNVIMRHLGGFRANEVMDLHATVADPALRPVVSEFLGRGAANIAMIAIGRMIVRPETARATQLADSTIQIATQAIKELNVGQIATKEIDNIAGASIEIARQEGGTVARLGISDDLNGVEELKQRLNLFLSQSEAANILNAGKASDASMRALTESIESKYVISSLQRIAKQEGGVERRMNDLLLEMGPDQVSRAVGNEVERQIGRLIPTITNKQKLKSEYLLRTQSMLVASGSDFSPVRQAASADAFERIFGKYFDVDGNIVQTGGVFGRGAQQANTVRSIARDFLLIDGAGFESANKWASQLNEMLTPISAKVPDPKVVEGIVAKYGEDGYRQIRKAAVSIGKIQVVRRKGFLFLSSARTMKDLYEKIQKIEQEGLKGISTNLSTRMENGQALVRQNLGDGSDVANIRSYINNVLMPNARATGDSYSISTLEEVLEKLKTSENLLDARKAWSTTAIEMSEEIASTFSHVENPDRIYKFIDQAIENGFALTPVSPDDMADLARILTAKGDNPAILEAMNDGRYTIARAPKSNYHRTMKIIENPNVDAPTKALVIQSQVRPFVDMTSPYLTEARFGTRYTANRLQHIMGSIFSPIGNSAVTNNIRNRMGSYLARGGITVGHVDTIMDEVVKEAILQGVSARGLTRESMDAIFRKAFDAREGFGGYDRFVDNWAAATAGPKQAVFKPVDAIMYSFQGDASVVGLSQYVSGGAKRFIPSIADITDKTYPKFRFKNNPLYWIQEFFESSTLNQARGVDRDVLKAIGRDGQMLSASAGEIRDLARVQSETHALIDNVNFLTIFREKALERALTGDWRVPEPGSFLDSIKGKLNAAREGAGRIRKAEAGEMLAERKQAANDALAADISSKNFAKELRDNDPTLYNALVSHYGTADSRTLMVRYVDYKRRLNDTQRVLSDIDAARPAGIGFNRIPDRESTVYNDVKYSLFGGRKSDGTEVSTILVRRAHIERPRAAMDNLDIQYQRMADAGYDMSLVDESFARTKSQLELIEDDLKRGANIDEGRIELFDKAYSSLESSMRKVQSFRNEADLRRLAAEVMIQDTGLSVGGQITFEGSRIAEALSLGAGYGEDIADVATTLQRIVRDAKAAVPTNDGRLIAEEIRRLSLEAIQNDSKLIEALDSANYTLVTRHGVEEEVFKAYRYTYEKALKQANKTTYYAPERSFFERSINHPFLGFYPYSYMFKKILPEMIEFLFKRPFGAMAPGAGYQSYIHVRDYVENQIETDYTLRTNLKNMDEVAFMLTQLFPGVPWDITAVPPAYLRNVARSLSGADKEYGFGDFVGRDIIGSFARIGPLATGENLAGAADQIITQLSGGNEPEPIMPKATGEIDFTKYGG
jgi:hypothetical protein